MDNRRPATPISPPRPARVPLRRVAGAAAPPRPASNRPRPPRVYDRQGKIPAAARVCVPRVWRNALTSHVPCPVRSVLRLAARARVAPSAAARRARPDSRDERRRRRDRGGAAGRPGRPAGAPLRPDARRRRPARPRAQPRHRRAAHQPARAGHADRHRRLGVPADGVVRLRPEPAHVPETARCSTAAACAAPTSSATRAATTSA